MTSFVAAMKNTFSLPNQTLGQFSEELKKLNNDDREWYSKALSEAGIEHEPPARKAG